ncbi:MAG TPA: helix-turn-helix domain-containing protein [Gemmatimonadaceae bacterium]|nr:helix-turn-helix domain-containing protein [Gemmatimonadaceae bacterium]
MEDWTLDAELETSPATGERLVEALRRGYQHFVLTSRDGIVSARVRLRIAGLARTRHCIGGCTLLVDWGNPCIHVQSQVVTLSRTELRLLAALLEFQGRPIVRSELISRVWPMGVLPPEESENALAVYVCSLRKRLAAAGLEGAIITIRRVGYQLRGVHA